MSAKDAQLAVDQTRESYEIARYNLKQLDDEHKADRQSYLKEVSATRRKYEQACVALVNSNSASQAKPAEEGTK